MDLLLMAAGFGSRLKERTQQLPKAMVELGGRPLIDYVLDRAMELPWVDRVIVVTGFERTLIVKHLEKRSFSKPVDEIFNPDYAKGNFYSLLKGLEHVGESWFVHNVDHIYPRSLYTHCFEQKRGVSAVCDFDRPLLDDCMKIQKEPHQLHISGIHKKLTQFNGGYIGLTFVSASHRQNYFKAVDAIERLNDPKAYAEMVLQKLIDLKEPPRIVNASGFGWLEIDDEKDYQHAFQTLKAHPRFLQQGLRA